MKSGKIKLILIPFLLLVFQVSFGQGIATVFGVILDSLNQPIEKVDIVIVGTNTGTSSKRNGSFKLDVPANQDIEIAFSTST